MLFERQQYQQDCVNNIINALDGIELSAVDTARLQQNIKAIARDNHLPSFDFKSEARLDVMMETGTGKTFTYLQTIFELHKRHQQKKFIIVVPRTAIKLGVIGHIEQTRDYFFNLYGRHLNYIDYPEGGLDVIQQFFINSNDLSVLLITNSSFNKKDNVINRPSEKPLLGTLGSTWQAVCSKKPVVIIDEPHLLKGGKTTQYLQQIEGLTIRFGATFPAEPEHKLSNVVYCLDSISAFNQYLVKQIGVSTVFVHSEESAMQVHNIIAPRRFETFYNLNEQLHKTEVYMKDDLGAKTGLNKYRGVNVTKIGSSKISLSDNTTLEASSGNYQLSDAEIEVMIGQTIKLHFKKEEKLFKRGIKALSLFFIPNISDFRGDEPRIKSIFEEQYKKIRQQVYDEISYADYKSYLDRDYKEGTLQVHEGYFSGDRGTKEEKEKTGVDIILKNKAALLSFDTPLRFVFSVWALQEGWDNPNIFTICKLSSTDRETNRRQQVGRGLRIAVNERGKRLSYQYFKENEEDFYAINALDMVVSSQEQGFIYQIQNEILKNSFSVVGDKLSLEVLRDKDLSDTEAALLYGALRTNNIIDQEGIIRSPVNDFLQSHRSLFSMIDDERFKYILSLFQNNTHKAVVDKNAPPKSVGVRPEQWEKFKSLWESINKKAKITYQNIKQETLMDAIANRFNSLNLPPLKNQVTYERFDAQQKQGSIISESSLDYATYQGLTGFWGRQSIIQFIQKLAREESLPLVFLSSLFSRLKIEYFRNNPKQARDKLAEIIKEEIHCNMLQKVQYQFTQTSIYGNALQNEDGTLKQKVETSKLGRFCEYGTSPQPSFLYDQIIYDSEIEKSAIEKDPAQVGDNTVTVFAKLPKIDIPTPYKKYNPDFAYLVKRRGDSQLFLVVETKGYDSEDNIPSRREEKNCLCRKVF